MILLGTVQVTRAREPRDERCSQYRPAHRAGRTNHHHPLRSPARAARHLHPHPDGAEADALCGAGYRERSAQRTNSRNGYRHREFDTGAGTLDLAIRKLRQGSYFPDWLLERRKRAERALTTVVATCYLLGFSTRRMDKLVETLGITSLSKSQVSAMAKELDTAVEAFRTRPLDAGPYMFVAADALVRKVREGGRVVNVHALIAVGVNARGLPRNPRYRRRHRRGRRRLADVLAVADRPWPFRGKLVTGGAHAGLVAAIGATLAGATWQLRS
jgi:putative transposase